MGLSSCLVIESQGYTGEPTPSNPVLTYRFSSGFILSFLPFNECVHAKADAQEVAVIQLNEHLQKFGARMLGALIGAVPPLKRPC